MLTHAQFVHGQRSDQDSTFFLYHLCAPARVLVPAVAVVVGGANVVLVPLDLEIVLDTKGNAV